MGRMDEVTEARLQAMLEHPHKAHAIAGMSDAEIQAAIDGDEDADADVWGDDSDQ